MLFNRPVRRLGCWGCGCAVLVISVIALACLGLLMLVTGRVRAAPLSNSLHEVAVVIDQSGSVVNRADTQALMRDLARHAVERWRRDAGDTHTVRVLAFGSRLTTVISTTSLSDSSLDSQLTRFFDQATSLSGTAYVPILTSLLTEAPAPSEIILITDGVPDPIGDPADYARQMRDLSRQYAQRGIGTSIFLVGSIDRVIWLPMWHDFANQTNGVLAEVKSTADIPAAIRALPIVAPAITPPLSPTPPPTIAPTVSATSALTPTLVVALPSATTSEPSAIPWPVIGLIGLWVIAMAALAIILLKGRAAAPQPARATAGDDGVLEVFDPDHDHWQRIELRAMAVGEVWLIGHAEHCQIRLDEVADEVAVIVMTPDGPQVDSRGAPLVFDGQFVQSHRLFDNDEVYAGRLILLYQNFFRPRPTVEAEDEAAPTSNLQHLTSNFQHPIQGGQHETAI